MPESKVRKAAAEKRKRTEASKSSEAKAGASTVGDAARESTRESARPAAKASSSGRRPSQRAGSARQSQPSTHRPWLLPAAIALAVLGVAWGVFYLVKPDLIPFMEGLGSWNLAIAIAAIVIAAVGYLALRPRTGTAYGPGSRRWVPPTFITVGLLGVAWLVLYYVAGQDIPFMAFLGNWNILIGMGGMAAAFVISTLWK